MLRHEVEFVVVGGVAAILEGAPVSTFDLAIVFEAATENLGRLIEALGELDATYLDPAGLRIMPDRDKLQTLKLHRLRTRHGILDALMSVDPGWSYRELLERSVAYDVEGWRIHVLELVSLIRSKEAAGRDKDRAVLPLLRRTLALKNDRAKG